MFKQGEKADEERKWDEAREHYLRLVTRLPQNESAARALYNAAAASLRGAFALGREHGYLFFSWWHPSLMLPLCTKALEAGIETEYVRRLIRECGLFPEEPPQDLIPRCETAGIFGAVAGILGSLQATEVLKELLGLGDTLAGRLMLYDGLSAQIRIVKVKRRPDCPSCGSI